MGILIRRNDRAIERRNEGMIEQTMLILAIVQSNVPTTNRLVVHSLNRSVIQSFYRKFKYAQPE